jgi:hypothetical protein
VVYALIGATWVSAQTTAELGDLTLSHKMPDVDRYRTSNDEVGIYIHGGGWVILVASVLFVGLALYSGSRSMRAAGLVAAMVGALVSLDIAVDIPVKHTVTTAAGRFILSESYGPWVAVGGFCVLAISAWLCPRQAKPTPAGWYPSQMVPYLEQYYDGRQWTETRARRKPSTWAAPDRVPPRSGRATVGRSTRRSTFTMRSSL